MIITNGRCIITPYSIKCGVCSKQNSCANQCSATDNYIYYKCYKCNSYSVYFLVDRKSFPDFDVTNLCSGIVKSKYNLKELCN